MERERLEELLRNVANGSLTPDEAVIKLKHFPFQDLGFARIDSHRSLRQGIAEVIFCPGKTAAQIAEIAHTLQQHHSLVLATRADAALASAVKVISEQVEYFQNAKLLIWGKLPAEPWREGRIALLTAGTADLPVAEEAALVMVASGFAVERIFDVGVAGIHRLMANLEQIRSCDVVVTVAGMDGVLPSVVAGLVEGPVIAVPTSVGYGASFDGLAALLTMMNSCAAGLTVVNIDNGFGAAVAAIRILSGRATTSGT